MAKTIKPAKPVERFINYMNDNITAINNSKLFAGLMIITLNISSKFVTIKLSKTMEAYLKFSFSRDILVFTISWMGSRDLKIALFITLLFKILMDFLFNEESVFCCLPESFTNYHINLMDNNEISDEEVLKAKILLEKVDARDKAQAEDLAKGNVKLGGNIISGGNVISGGNIVDTQIKNNNIPISNSQYQSFTAY
jgi:hypothetical protein